jgi:hypothetical protein
MEDLLREAAFEAAGGRQRLDMPIPAKSRNLGKTAARPSGGAQRPCPVENIKAGPHAYDRQTTA